MSEQRHKSKIPIFHGKTPKTGKGVPKNIAMTDSKLVVPEKHNSISKPDLSIPKCRRNILEQGNGKGDTSKEEDVKFEADEGALKSILNLRGIDATMKLRPSTPGNVDGKRSSIYYQPATNRLSLMESYMEYKQNMVLFKERMRLMSIASPTPKVNESQQTPKEKKRPCSIYYTGPPDSCKNKTNVTSCSTSRVNGNQDSTGFSTDRDRPSSTTKTPIPSAASVHCIQNYSGKENKQLYTDTPVSLVKRDAVPQSEKNGLLKDRQNCRLDTCFRSDQKLQMLNDDESLKYISSSSYSVKVPANSAEKDSKCDSQEVSLLTESRTNLAPQPCSEKEPSESIKNSNYSSENFVPKEAFGHSVATPISINLSPKTTPAMPLLGVGTTPVKPLPDTRVNNRVMFSACTPAFRTFVGSTPSPVPLRTPKPSSAQRHPPRRTPVLSSCLKKKNNNGLPQRGSNSVKKLTWADD